MWFVTVMERADEWLSTGDQRTWGFYIDKETAVKSLYENWTDMHETNYEYAVIEEYDEGISNYLGNRQWFKWNKNKQGYVEINEPKCFQNVVCFAIG